MAVMTTVIVYGIKCVVACADRCHYLQQWCLNDCSNELICLMAWILST